MELKKEPLAGALPVKIEGLLKQAAAIMDTRERIHTTLIFCSIIYPWEESKKTHPAPAIAGTG